MLYLPPPRRLTLSLSPAAHLPSGDLLGSAAAAASVVVASSLSQRHCLRAALAACSTLRSNSLRPLLLVLRSSLGVRLLALANKLLLLRLPALRPPSGCCWRPLMEDKVLGSRESSSTGRVARHVSGSSSSSPALPGRDQRPLLPGEPRDRADDELDREILNLDNKTTRGHFL